MAKPYLDSEEETEAASDQNRADPGATAELV